MLMESILTILSRPRCLPSYFHVSARRLFHIVDNLLVFCGFFDNIEDFLGHSTHLVFYLLCGVAAALAFIAIRSFIHASDPRRQRCHRRRDRRLHRALSQGARSNLVVLIVFFTFWWIPAWVFFGILGSLIQFIATTMDGECATAAHQTGGVAFLRRT